MAPLGGRGKTKFLTVYRTKCFPKQNFEYSYPLIIFQLLEICRGYMDAPAIVKFAEMANFHEQRAITPKGIM